MAVLFNHVRGKGMSIMSPMHLIAVLCIASLTGCASLPGSVTEQIEGRRVEYVMTKNGPDVVVFENGLCGQLHWWAKVYPEISRSSSAFAYNRPGYGRSDKAATPRDGQHVVDELRGLLKAKGLNPPYILVGHSLGGLYMQLYARLYPDEVRALILVDSTHPSQFKGKGNPEHWPTGLNTAMRMLLSESGEREFDAINSTGEQILNLPTFTGKPVIVLSPEQPLREELELAQDINEKRKDLIRLYPGAKQVWVDSGHDMPLEKPESVVAAIRELLPESTSPAQANADADAKSAGRGVRFDSE
jgi:pimeloyl-ACP methyl ester carboxylesterase